MDEAQFRERLQKITTDRSSDLWLADIEQLRREFPHNIRSIEVKLNRGFNCFAFALGLTSSGPYFAIASESEFPNVHANSKFMRWFLNEKQPKGIEQLNGVESVIIYFDGSEPKHAGRFRNGRALSKWGSGPWFEHDIFEVPRDYGDTVKYFDFPPVHVVENSFLEFAASEGVPVKKFVPNWREHHLTQR
jgi:hypothetical protein